MCQPWILAERSDIQSAGHRYREKKDRGIKKWILIRQSIALIPLINLLMFFNQKNLTITHKKTTKNAMLN